MQVYTFICCSVKILQENTLYSLKKRCTSHVNSKQHSARITQEKILYLRWSYSQDHAPSDFHLFYYQQNALNDKRFSQEDLVKTFVKKSMRSKPAELYL